MRKITLIGFVFFILFLKAQNGPVIQKDQRIDSLLEIKKTLNLANIKGGLYKIQVYFGDKAGAKQMLESFREAFPNLPCEIVFETPNYKVKAGNFFTRLEAEKNLLIIRKKTPSAFLVLPRRNGTFKPAIPPRDVNKNIGSSQLNDQPQMERTKKD